MTNIALPRRYTLPTWGLTLVVALVAELVYFSLTTRQFAGHGTGMLVLTEQFVPVGILALGAGMVILTGNIDLSAGATASLSAIVVGTELRHGTGMWAAIGIAVAAGVGFGLFNGFVVAFLGVDSLLVTLATQFIATSLATSIGGESPPYGFSDMFQRIGTGLVGPVPVPVIIFAVAAILCHIVLRYTRYGRSVYAVGGNLEAARLSGLRVDRIVVSVYVIVGFFSGLAAFVLAARLNSAEAVAGLGYELTVISAVVIGGTSLFGGIGSVGGTVVGAALIGVLQNGLQFNNVSSYTQSVVIGLILILAVAFDRWLKSRARV